MLRHVSLKLDKYFDTHKPLLPSIEFWPEYFGLLECEGVDKMNVVNEKTNLVFYWNYWSRLYLDIS